MNPLHRKREHQHAWIVITVTEVIAGLLFQLINSAPFAICKRGRRSLHGCHFSDHTGLGLDLAFSLPV